MRQLSHVPQAHWSRTPGSPGAFAGKKFIAQLPHSRGAKRRENGEFTRRVAVGVERFVIILCQLLID
jgi:hypothetical protein